MRNDLKRTSWSRHLLAVLLLVGLLLGGCRAPSLVTPASKLPQGQAAPEAGPSTPKQGADPVVSIPLAGRVDFPGAGGYGVQATAGRLVDSATVTLMDTAGNVLASGLTDQQGAFTLNLDFSPAANGIYVLEAARGLVNATPGNSAARLRTIVKRTSDNKAWLSISNGTTAQEVLLNPLTTAVALQAALDPANVAPANTIGKVDPAADPAALKPTPVYVNHSDDEIRAVADNLVSFLLNDADPVQSVSGIAPTITSLSPTTAAIASVVTITGTGFVPLLGKNTVSFKGGNAEVLYATSTRLVVSVPALAVTGKVSVSTQFGKSNEITFTVSTTTITVNPSTFMGKWRIAGVQSYWQMGTGTAIPISGGGTYTMLVSGFDSFTFQVAANGTVTSLSGCATHSGSTLTFNVSNATIDPAQDYMPWQISGASNWEYGKKTVPMIRNNQATIVVSGYSNSVVFAMDGNGNVATTSGVATVSGSTLTFTTTDVTFNLNGYSGLWSLDGVSVRDGNQTLKLLRGGRYRMWLRGAAIAINFNIDAAGTVTIDQPQATVSGTTITIPVTKVIFDANGYVGSWGLNSIYSGAFNQVLYLAQYQKYELTLPGLVNPLEQTFEIGAGTATTIASSAIAAAPSGADIKLTFQTVRFMVKTNAFSGNWWITNLTRNVMLSDQWVVGIKGCRYYFSVYDDSFYFDVKADGSLAPEDTTIASWASPNLDLKTGLVRINANGNTENWNTYADVTSSWRSGSTDGTTSKPDVNVIRGMAFRFYFEARGSATYRLGTGSSTTVTVMSGNQIVDGVTTTPASIKFNTTTVVVDPATNTSYPDFVGNWSIDYVRGYATGSFSLALIKDAAYRIRTYGGSALFYTLTNGDIKTDQNNGFIEYNSGATHRLDFVNDTVTVRVNSATARTLTVDGVGSVTDSTATTDPTMVLVRSHSSWKIYNSAASSEYFYFEILRGTGVARPSNLSFPGAGSAFSVDLI